MAWDPADLRLPGWLLRLLDALARLRLKLPGGWRIGLTRPGIVFAAAWTGVWGAAFWSANNLLYVCAGLLTGIAAVAIRRGAALLACARAMPLPCWGHGEANQPRVVAFEADTNAQDAGRVELRWAWREEGGAPAIGEACAALRFTPGRMQGRARLPAMPRGVFWMHKAHFSTAAPVGLFVLEKACEPAHAGAAAEWIVLPRAEAWPAGIAGEGAGPAGIADGDAWRDLRAYAAGDAPRRIHWRKAGDAPEDWLVKRFAREEGGSRRLCVDLRPPPGLARGGEAFERMLGRARFWLERAQAAERLTLGRQSFDLRDEAGRMAALRALAMAAPDDAPPAPCDGLWLRADTP